MCYGSFQSGCDYVSWQFIRKSLKNKYLKSQRDNGGKSFCLLHNRHKKENRLNMLIVFFQTLEMQAKILCPKNISAESRHKKGLKQGSSLSQCFTFKEMVLSEFLYHTTKYSLYSLIYLVNVSMTKDREFIFNLEKQDVWRYLLHFSLFFYGRWNDIYIREVLCTFVVICNGRKSHISKLLSLVQKQLKKYNIGDCLGSEMIKSFFLSRKIIFKNVKLSSLNEGHSLIIDTMPLSTQDWKSVDLELLRMHA